MYEVVRTESELTVRGSNGFVKALNPDAIGVVLRASLHWHYGEPEQYSVQCRDMTDAEVVAQALEITAYPQF